MFKVIGGILLFNVVLPAGLLVLPAGELTWWRAWVLIGVHCAAVVAVTVRLFHADRGMLRERSKPPIQQGQPAADKVIAGLLAVSSIGLLVFTSLDVFRFHMLGGPGVYLSWSGLVMFVLGWTLAAGAVLQNAFAVVAVRHQEDRQQAVIDSGLYAVIRHPMYAGFVLLLIGIPLWLESYAGVLLAVAPAGLLVARVLVEERFLRRELHGYDGYTARVRYRLVPHLW